MATRSRTAASSICLILILYILQGINLGLTGSLPLFLVTHGASWKDRGTFNFAFYPFSLKLLWAPLIDAFYSKRFGRRKSWLIPIQLSMAGILFLLSFYIESFITDSRIMLLAVIFFALVFLTATQDVCVDGLAVSLFTATNPQWASTSQTMGQTMGRFLGSSFLLTFESANFTNRFIREPLSLSPQSLGLFSLEQFVRFVAVTFLVVTVCLFLFFHEKQDVSTANGEEIDSLSLVQTYFSIVKLFKKKCIQQFTLFALLSPAGMVAVGSMTSLQLVNQGVPREYLALVSIPVTLATIVAPLIIRHTKLPLSWFAGSYVMILIFSIPIAAYVYFTPYLISSYYYYPLLILLLTCVDFIGTLRFTSVVGFGAAISEPRIGGTYMTLLATLSNLGFALNSSAILYLANWFPKKYAYVMAIGLCIVLGILWIGFSFRTLKWLQKLPIYEWHLIPEITKDNATGSNERSENDHGTSLILNQETDQVT